MVKYRESLSFNYGTSTGGKNCDVEIEDQGTEQQQKEREGTPVRETVQIMAQGSVNFIITPDMLFIDEETM
jgi:hypothetical protein